MNDHVKVLYPMPDGAPAWAIEHAREGRALTNARGLKARGETMTIAEDGRLILSTGKWAYVPDEERTHYGTPEWDVAVKRNEGAITFQHEEDVEIDYHGDITFWTTWSNENAMEYVEWRARFTEGRCTGITREKLELLDG